MTRSEPNLRIPGPTSLPPSVREAGARQMINHRGPEFKALLGRLQAGMKPYFGTSSDVAILSCAGTGGLEAAVVNTLSPGDRVLGVSIGAFGDRFAKIAEAYGASVDRVAAEWGWAAAPDEVRERLGGGDYKAVLLTHNETSTGVMNPIARARRRGPRGGAGRADPRRHRVVARRRAVRDGRVGRRRRRDGLAEGVDGGARAGDGRRLAARVGRDGDGEDAALLPRPAQAPRRDRRRRDAVDPRDRGRLPGRRGHPADGRGGHGRRLRAARRVRRGDAGRPRGARLPAVRRADPSLEDGHRGATSPTASTGRAFNGDLKRAASSSPAARASSRARSSGSAISGRSPSRRSSTRIETLEAVSIAWGREVQPGAAVAAAERAAAEAALQPA